MRVLVRSLLLALCALVVATALSTQITVTQWAPDDVKVRVDRKLRMYACPPGCLEIETDANGAMHRWTRAGFDEYMTLRQARDEFSFVMLPACSSRGCFSHRESACKSIARYCDERFVDLDGMIRSDIVWVSGEWFRNLHSRPSKE